MSVFVIARRFAYPSILLTLSACYAHTPAPAASACLPSQLYGRAGESWKADGRLIDASFAGYHTGVDPLPAHAPAARVTDFGARGDDEVDDTQAFLDGIARTEGVLLIPAGRYIVSQRLDIEKNNFVLRGEGPGKSILFFPRPLASIYGKDWSFSGGFITVTGRDAGPVLATLSAPAPRGARTLSLSAPVDLAPGSWVRIVQKDDGQGSLFAALYGGQHPGNVRQDGGREVFHHYSRVTAVSATSVTLERPLPLEVDPRWTPELRAATPTTREVGIEHLTLEMAGSPYPGHFNEEGYNAIYFQGAHDSWVRDVVILNADYGVHFNRSFFCTATGVVLDATFDRGPVIGHHGLTSSGGADVVFSNFDLRKKYVHDLSVDGYAMTTVWSSGKGVDLNFDHHGRAPYGTLWTNIDVGRATRPFGSGGARNRMPHTGAFTTVWNVRGSAPVGLPRADFGPLMNLVGVTGTNGRPAPAGYLVEDIPGEKLCQPDLYRAMVERRQ